MLDRLPDTLFRTKRGLCPCCGAPLPLSDDTSNITCGFCGATAVLERRLRRAEPEVPGAPLRQFDSHDHAGWTRTDRLRESYSNRPTCPGCALAIDEPEHSSAVTCPGCGTECHLERRLVPPPVHPLRAVPRPRHPREVYAFDLQDDDDPKTEHLIYRLSIETDTDRSMDLASWFGRWTMINATTSRLMPVILKRMHDGHRPLAFQLSSAVNKCLCSDGVKARETIAALEPWVLRVPAERQLLSSLGLGTALGLKLLLDSSMLAHSAGDNAQSVACLFAINWMLQRNYPEHPIISQILMHRMFYLAGPPLAFCVMFMHGQVSDVAFRYDPKTTLAFLDDAVAERPILIPSLDHERAFWCGHSPTPEDWNDRFAFTATLRTDQARLASWRHYLAPPDEAPPDLYDAYVARLLPMLEDERPDWQEMAAKRLEWMIRRLTPTPDAFHRLVAQRGESLPANIRRAMLSAHPKCGLSHQNLPYNQAEPKHQEHPQIIEARLQYKNGLDDALAAKQNDQQAWKAYWDARGGQPASPPEIFDGSCEAPAPDERRSGNRKPPAPRPWDPPAAPHIDPDARTGSVSDPDAKTAPDTDPAETTPSSATPAPAGTTANPIPPQTGGVTIWEWVATLPPDQQAQYADTLKQLEPHRAMIEAAMAAQRAGASPSAATPSSPATPSSQSEPGPTPPSRPRKPFGRRPKP